MARVALWEGFRLDAAMVSKVAAFLVHGGLEHQFQENPAIRYAVRIAVDRCLSKAGLIRGSRKSQTARGYGSCGDELVSGNAGVDTTPTSIYKCGNLLILKRVVFCVVPCVVVQYLPSYLFPRELCLCYTDESSGIR